MIWIKQNIWIWGRIDPAMERRRLLDIPQINPGNREEKVQVVSRLSVRDLGDREEIGR